MDRILWNLTHVRNGHWEQGENALLLCLCPLSTTFVAGITLWYVVTYFSMPYLNAPYVHTC